jgi:hypothetical protein
MVAAQRKSPKEALHPHLFDEAWAVYPKRPGNNRRAAVAAWNARVREGVSPEEMVAGVVAYALYVAATGTGPLHTKMASTFFGPSHFFRDDYSVEPEAPAGAGADLLKFYDDEPLV